MRRETIDPRPDYRRGIDYAAGMLPEFIRPRQVSLAPSHQRAAALELVFEWESLSQRQLRVASLLEAAVRRPDMWDHLLVAHDGERLRGAAWGQILPGRVANVWPPGLATGEREDTADALQSQLDEQLVVAQMTCLQALLPTQATRAVARLLKHGYQLAAELAFLLCGSADFPTSRPDSPVEFLACRPCDRSRLVELVDETYVDTRDAPALNGVRPTSLVIEGYQHSGTYVPDWWLIARHGDHDVGCLLLTDHPQLHQVELIYMGLIPDARGAGFGIALVRQALWIARCAQREAMWTAVDAANEPALRSYARCGFRQFDHRLAFFKRTSSTAARDAASGD
ncbi:MAG: GNAT family N-acetyltransferase [Pirellulaceae bacterium]